MLERDGAAEPDRAVRDGILSHSGARGPPATLEGRIVRIVDRVAYINHDIDDALRAGIIAEADLPARPIEVLGTTGSRRIDTLVHDLVEHSDAAGDIVQSERDRRRDGRAARVHVRARLPRARGAREHAKIHGVVRALFEHYCAHPEEIPDSIPAGDLARRVTDYLAGMTDRFCIARVRGVERAGGVRAVTRYTADSRDRVLDAVDMLALVGARLDLRRAGVDSYFGLCPFHDERTASFHVRPDEKHYHCFGCQVSGDPFDFVMETEGLDFKAALESAR